MPQWLDAIHTAALESYACDDPILADRVIAYVVNGGDPGTLLPAVRRASRSAQSQNAVHQAARAHGRRPQWPVFALLDSAPVDQALRWAQIVAETLSAHTSTGAMVDVAGGQLFYRLLVAIDDAAVWQRDKASDPLPVRYPTVDALVTAAGGRPGELLEAAFTAPPDRATARWPRAHRTLTALSGYAAAVERHATTLGPVAAAQPTSAHPAHLTLWEPLGGRVLGVFADALARCVTSDDPEVSVGADTLARRCDPAVLVPSLKHIAAEGVPAARAAAIRAVHTLSPPDSAWALQTAAADRAASVRSLVDELSGPAQPTAALDPPPENTGWHVDVTPELIQALDRLLGELPPQSTDRARRHVLEQLRSDSPPRKGSQLGFPLPQYGEPLERFARNPAVDATAVFTVVCCFDWLTYGRSGGGLTVPVRAAFEAGREATGRPTLAELSARLDAIGADGTGIVWASYSHDGFGRDWPDDAVWPFVAGHLDTVLSAATSDGRHQPAPDAPFRAMGTLPHLPPRAVDALFTVAIGRNADKRPLAQATLRNATGIVARIVTALADGKADTRAIAARWLGDIGDPGAVPALTEALRSERNDMVKGALYDGLSALGQSLGTYLNPETLTAEAAGGMKGGVPRTLDWLDLDLMPPLHWESGDTVDPRIGHWLLTTAVKNKTPEPDAMMRHHCRLFRADDRERLASFVLGSWVGADERGVKVIGAKGVLAVVAACGGDNAVAMAHAYLYKHYGVRAAHCRALLAMLAWTDTPQAVQTLLAVATKFRTRGLREEAESQVNAMAARRGWTPEELADRTAADGGFDADGVLRLEYLPGDGDRTFTATVQPDLTLVLRAADGGVIKALPAPRRSDDQQAAAAAKKQLTAARKVLKTAATVHTGRLYAAMCGQRTWRHDDWENFVQRHPVVGQLARRLVWTDGDTTFRPLDDGTLTDADDEEVTLAPDTPVRLAHALTVDPGCGALWHRHFTDYEVIALFDQFREPWRLSADEVRAKVIAAPPVSMPYFTFRAVASRLGYTMGRALDGPEVYDFEKTLPTLGVTVSVHFSGVAVTQPNDTVRLEFAGFTPTGAGRRYGTLGDVPPVLLSEVYNDVRQIASAGEPVGAGGHTGGP